MKNTPPTNRLIVAILAVLVGLFMIAVAPYLVQISLHRVLTSLIEVSKEKPQYSSGIILFSLFFPVWRAFIFVGGVTLIVIAPSLYKGEEWAYPAGLLASAFGGSGGMFMFLPYVSWVDGFPIPMAITFVSLIYFWASIFLRKVGVWEKVAQFLTLTFMGMLTTHAFVIGIAAQRMLLTRPEKPLFAGLEWWILTMSGEVNWIGVVLLIVAIPLLAFKRKAGWWLALFAACSILIVDAPTQIIRTATLDYLYGSLLSIGLLLWLLLPRFKKALLGEG